MKAHLARLASPATAALLGLLMVVCQAVSLWLAILSHQGDLLGDVSISAVPLTFGVVGVVVARREPRNPLGWLLGAVGLSFIVCTVGAANYLAFDYGSHGGGLPLGSTALVLGQLWPVALFLGPLAILLFPDGRLPARRWRRVVGAYLAAAGLLTAQQVMLALNVILRGPVHIDRSGYITNPTPRALSGGVFTAAGAVLVAFCLACFVAFLARQVVSYRRSAGERRQQLKWVMCGAAVTAVSVPGFVAGGSADSVLLGVLTFATVVGLAALPLSIGVAILKYRLYEIDRLISRTLAYAVVTGLLVSVYFGVVALTTDALPLSSPVGVAASTLAAAALFNPLRRRVQHLVDRRFNRARYDAEATLAAFTAQLRDAIDLNSIGVGLVEMVNRAVEPDHASLWIRPSRSGPDRG